MRGAIKVPWREPQTDGPSRLEEAHSELVLMRLHELVKAGYRAKLGADAGGAPQIYLDHPNAQPLTLWPDGQVLDQNPYSIKSDSERTIIHSDDDFIFDEFISSVPKLNIINTVLNMTVGNFLSYFFAYLIFLGVVLLVGLSIKELLY